MLRGLLQTARVPLLPSAALASVVLHNASGGRQRNCCCQGQASTAHHSDHLSAFGLGEIPSSAYKTHFTAAHDNAAAASAANVARRETAASADLEPKSDRHMRRLLAQQLMAKIGYTQSELEILGDDVLRMQGVGSPFTAAQLRHGETVVDLGSGLGPDAFLAAAKVGPAGSVIGINLSSEEVQKANLRAQELGLSEARCRFVTADMEITPLGAATADVAISNGGFCLCPDKPAAFREVHRLLRPGGRMAISCTVLRTHLPALEGKRWPPCMEVFMPRSNIEPILNSVGFRNVRVDDTNSRMDVWDFESADLDSVAESLGPDPSAGSAVAGCSHAKKAAARRAKQDVEDYLARGREAGIHWGNPQFDHIKEFDMNDLCARIVIYAEKSA
mmetsp:Transcript_93562/g.180390  ORF Transcript_93562/g.180390 Transcript_93562/m.180390 type:complete len:389 (+) Transcript_93562:71-1237(+)